MEIILLSGGSGKRLWPLSNNARSKQFLRLLPSPDGGKESMVQRIARQIADSELDANITFATSITQKDSIISQLGDKVDIVTEPERRDTFPAIALATSYLHKEKRCSRDEVVVVMPSDPFTEQGYFSTIAQMVKGVETGEVEMVLMGITPTCPATKFGYIVPQTVKTEGELIKVKRFTEKPNEEVAKELLGEGAVWNGGVFAFKLGYLIDIVEKYIKADNFSEIHSRYSEFPKISFDYEVAEKAKSVGVVPFKGIWNDLGTWDTLIQEIKEDSIGNVVLGEGVENSSIINELDIPIICLGAKNMVIAASPDGILVSEREASVNLKGYADSINLSPMYEELSWGTYKVISQDNFVDGVKSETRLLHIKEGCSLDCLCYNKIDKVITILDGKGRVVIDDKVKDIERGFVANIVAGQKHSILAITDLKIIEVQTK